MSLYNLFNFTELSDDGEFTRYIGCISYDDTGDLPFVFLDEKFGFDPTRVTFYGTISPQNFARLKACENFAQAKHLLLSSIKPYFIEEYEADLNCPPAPPKVKDYDLANISHLPSRPIKNDNTAFKPTITKNVALSNVEISLLLKSIKFHLDYYAFLSDIPNFDERYYKNLYVHLTDCLQDDDYHFPTTCTPSNLDGVGILG